MLGQQTIDMKTKTLKTLISFVMLTFLGYHFSSCYYDVEEELYPMLTCDTTNVSYSNDILPIVKTNCYRCHDAANNFGGITLEGYVRLKDIVDKGRILGAIKQETGFSPMPKNSPKLIDCDIMKLEKWISEGAVNN